MGNRAVIEFKDTDQGIYLHWHGGIESVQAFLDCAKRYKLRSGSYGHARLCQIIGNFFGGTLSLGTDKLCNLHCDNYDNGVFIVNENFNIVGRKYGMADRLYNEEYYFAVFKECCEKNDAIFKYEENKEPATFE